MGNKTFNEAGHSLLVQSITPACRRVARNRVAVVPCAKLHHAAGRTLKLVSATERNGSYQFHNTATVASQ